MSSDECQPDSSSVPTEVATPVATDEVLVDGLVNGLNIEITDELSEDIASIDGTEQEIQPMQSDEHIENPLVDEQQVQELSLVSNIEVLSSTDEQPEQLEEQLEQQQLEEQQLEEQLQTIRDQLTSSKQPSVQPSIQVSTQGSTQRSKQPSKVPSIQVSTQPSIQVSTHPSKQPSKAPSTQPSQVVSKQPSHQPSKAASTQASTHQSKQPSKAPSSQVSTQPSIQPSIQPSRKPSFAASVHHDAISMSQLEHQLHQPIEEEVVIQVEPSTQVQSVNQVQSATGPSFEPVVNGTTRNRKTDRRNLANDILAELPISIRFNENAFIDGNQDPANYLQDWEQWNENLDDDGYDLLEVLIMTIAEDELKYKRSSKRNNYWNKGIQTALFVMGTAIVYIQASSTSAEVITRFNVASGIGTSIATMLLGLGNFAKKGPHFNKTSTNLMQLRCWIENKLILPLDRRYSPYDIYTIAKIAHEAILLDAKQGLNESK